jgi:hypothetical protein
VRKIQEVVLVAHLQAVDRSPRHLKEVLIVEMEDVVQAVEIVKVDVIAY